MKSRLAPGMDGGDLLGRDRTDDLFHVMEARSQLRHTPTIADEKPKPGSSGPGSIAIIFAHITGIVNAQRFFSRAEIYQDRRREND